MKRRFERLVDEHAPRLLQLARFLLRSDSEAEDVVQDALIKLWNHLPELDAGGELAWLVTCTRNACLDRIRRDQRQTGLRKQAFDVERTLDRHIDRDDPDAVSLRNERVQALQRAIAGLAEPGRSLIVLRDIQDIDVATVAATLSLTENQVRVYTFRARRTLRRQLEEACHEQVA
jgi:RNA polymerase sigma-70 factor (ECF subfamily)